MSVRSLVPLQPSSRWARLNVQSLHTLAGALSVFARRNPMTHKRPNRGDRQNQPGKDKPSRCPLPRNRKDRKNLDPALINSKSQLHPGGSLRTTPSEKPKRGRHGQSPCLPLDHTHIRGEFARSPQNPFRIAFSAQKNRPGEPFAGAHGPSIRPPESPSVRQRATLKGSTHKEKLKCIPSSAIS